MTPRRLTTAAALLAAALVAATAAVAGPPLARRAALIRAERTLFDASASHDARDAAAWTLAASGDPRATAAVIDAYAAADLLEAPLAAGGLSEAVICAVERAALDGPSEPITRALEKLAATDHPWKRVASFYLREELEAPCAGLEPLLERQRERGSRLAHLENSDISEGMGSPPPQLVDRLNHRLEGPAAHELRCYELFALLTLDPWKLLRAIARAHALELRLDPDRRVIEITRATKHPGGA